MVDVGTDVVLFYFYEDLGKDGAAKLAEEQRKLGSKLSLFGRVLVAEEGINGTVQGTAENIATYKSAVERVIEFSGSELSVDWKHSKAGAEPVFPDFAVKEVPELVAFGLHGRQLAGGVRSAPLDIKSEGGQHLSPKCFHKTLLETPSDDLRLIDVRNTFEYEVGHFEGATDPGLSHTAQWPKFVEDNIEDLRGKTIMMYCTGGIRCEKASAYLRRRLRESEPENEQDPDVASYPSKTEVFQLKGGIHRYLESFPEGGLFRGSNFIFDRRASMRPEDTAATVVGRCSECNSPWDRHHGGRVCCVCRSLVLVCDECDNSSSHGEYYCSEHSVFRGCFYHFVDKFGAAELESQLSGLHTLLSLEVGQGRKNRRTTIRKKIEQVETRLAIVRKESESIVAPPRRCRACEEPFSDCPGACWGFWKDPQTI